MTNKPLPQAVEPQIYYTGELMTIIENIDFVDSCVDFKWRFEIEEVWSLDPASFKAGKEPVFKGWHVNTVFNRPDTNTGEIGEGPSRKEFIPAGSTASGVFKTCYLLVFLTTWHEIMESMIYKGFRPFDPHNSVDELVSIQKAKREATPGVRRKNFVTLIEVKNES